MLRRIVLYGAGYQGGQPLCGVRFGPRAIRKSGLKGRIKKQLGKTLYRLEDIGDLRMDPIKYKSYTTKKLHKYVGKANEQIYKDLGPYFKQKETCITLGGDCPSTALDRFDAQGNIIVTLGGDHSIAMGTISAMSKVYQKQNPLVVWVDAHVDINTKDSSPSGNIHGMPVAFLLGLEKNMGKDDDGFEWLKPRLKPESFVYIGTRDVDEEEHQLLHKLGIDHYTMDDIAKQGIDDVMDRVFKVHDPSGTRPIHLSFDVDGFDPSVIKSTGTKVDNGLSYEEGLYIAQSIERTKRMVSMDMVEVNPEIGSQSDVEKTATIASDVICAALGC